VLYPGYVKWVRGHRSFVLLFCVLLLYFFPYVHGSRGTSRGLSPSTYISYEKLTNLTDRFSSAFHTILQNFRQKKVEFFLFYGKAGFFVSFVKIVCEALKGKRNYLVRPG
jgi:hypothetical protein